jgi:Flp pilus assembly protein protease CpaA
VYYMPNVLGGADLKLLYACTVGYSNIIFGVLMIYALSGT